MKVTKRILSLLLVFLMLFAMAGCVTTPDETTAAPGTTGNPGANVDKGTYTVKLTTAGGMALSGYQVLIYDDPACKAENIVDMGKTDENGNAKFTLKKNGEYYIQLDKAMLKGYDVKEYYEFDGTTADLTLTSALIQGESVSSNVFKLGDVMYDFSFEDSSVLICSECNTKNDNDGTLAAQVCSACGASLQDADYQTVTLSEVLAEKELVVLNFWYSTCYWCVEEFPVLQQAYEMLGDKVEVFGLNPYEEDSANSVASFKANSNLTFPMGKVEMTFNPSSFLDPATNSAITGYPTSVFVDRYGVICMIEAGAVTTLTDWSCIMSHFVGDDYEQILVRDPADIVEKIEPTVENPTSEEIDNAFTGSDDVKVTYRWEEGKDAQYAWPFLAGEKDGESCIYASNSGIYESFSLMYVDVTLEKGDVLAFDYWASSEKNCDVLYVIVENQPIYTLSGVRDGWSSAYCWIADEPGTYELALCYQKDSDDSTVRPEEEDKIEDNVYLKNLRVVSIADIDTASYLPRQAGNKNESGTYDYVDVVLNEQDGYYHVGTENGPLLLAGLYDYTQLSQEEYLYMWSENKEIVDAEGHNYHEDLIPYYSAATNSNLLGWCTVTEELAEILKVVADIKGSTEDEKEWLLLCKYFDAYGTNGVQLEDPVAGLKKWSALTATEGVGVETNMLSFNGNPIMPKGKMARFTPTKSGAYRITSSTNFRDSLEAWVLVDEYDGFIYEYQHDEMLSYLYCDNNNVTIVMYMEAGKNYYISMSPYDNTAVCDIWYDIEYVGESYDLFRSCSPAGWFTTRDEISMDEDNLISIGIDVILNPEDGLYHQDLGKDENGNQLYGSIVYAYFIGGTPLFSDPITDVPLYNEDGTPKLDAVTGEQLIIKGMINKGGFDFTLSADDEQILHYLEMHKGDQEATLDYINNLPVVYDMETVLDVFAGKYHGLCDSDGDPIKDANGNPINYDMTEEMRTYLDKMISDSEHPELEGCVPVDARLAEMLQSLVDKYSFAGVEYSWLKLCYYYDHLG